MDKRLERNLKSILEKNGKSQKRAMSMSKDVAVKNNNWI